MAATGKTKNYDLATYNPNDTTTWDDFNENMEKIDKALEENSGVVPDTLNTYTPAPTETDIYSANYINTRLNNPEVTVGQSARGQGRNGGVFEGVSIGKSAYSTVSSSTTGSSVYNNYAVVIGKEAKADCKRGNYSVVIGSGANSTEGETSNGNVVVGDGAKASGYGSVSIGSNAYAGAKSSTGSDSITGYPIAIGYSAGDRGMKSNSVAIGCFAQVTRNNEFSIGNTDRFAPYTRYLSNVTAGELDTDAVNLKQMKDYVEETVGEINVALVRLNTGAGV